MARGWQRRSNAAAAITAEDLAERKERQPIRGSYRGYEIISAPPPSSGGVTLIETLNILEAYNLGKLANRSADSMHVTAEAFRRAFFDRAELLGDSDFSQIPVAQLIDKKYAEAWRQSLDTMRATESKDVHRPAGFGDSIAPPRCIRLTRAMNPPTPHIFQSWTRREMPWLLRPR
jgi:gamma-glutamyltranspeptidase/glutathione hydrolase